jgi:hypothetical protein
MCDNTRAESHVSQTIDRRYIDCVAVNRFSHMIEHPTSDAATHSRSKLSLCKKLFVEMLKFCLAGGSDNEPQNFS